MMKIEEQIENAYAKFMENNYNKFINGFRINTELKKNIMNFYIQKEDYEKCQIIAWRCNKSSISIYHDLADPDK